MTNVIEAMQARGFIEAMTSDDLVRHVEKPIKVYIGFDPTASSLHLGNLVGIIALGWFQRFGHTPVIIMGGATAKVGDPSGKSIERPRMSDADIAHNLAGIRTNFQNVLNFAHPTATPLMLNNDDWFKKFSATDFLRDVGKYFRLGPMLAKEAVRARLASEEGMSFTEFSYQLLQAYDFLHLYDAHGVTLEGGGSDQWGNITAGIELVRRVRSQTVYGITFPLLTRSDGKKFGKTEEGAIWLSSDKLSAYDFYQHLYRVADADVLQLLRMLTYIDLGEIREYERQMAAPGYVPNTVQKRLAAEVTRLVHGEGGLQVAERVTQAAAPGAEMRLDAATLQAVAKEMPNVLLKRSECLGKGVVDVMVLAGLAPSKGEARRLIKNGGVYMNNLRVEGEQATVEEEHLLEGEFILLAVGKKNKVLVRL